MSHPAIRPFFHEATNTVSYLVFDPVARRAAVIDPVLDFDPATGKTDSRAAEAIVAYAANAGLTVDWILETHIHADHLSAAPIIKAWTGARIGIGEHVGAVRRVFGPLFDAADPPAPDDDFDHLFADGAQFAIGGLTVDVLHTPGHTPADVSYRIGDAVFVGDTLFMPDCGTARTDFPGGDARTLFRSIGRLLALPAATRLFACHDYKAPGRDAFAWESTVGAQRAGNIHIHDGVTEDEFVRLRTERDATLAVPRLLLPAIQVNIRAGHFPPPRGNGVRYLVIPVTRPDVTIGF